MKSHTSTDARGAEGVDATAVEIGVDERRDAIRLMDVLIPFHSFLVQHGQDHWVVHARAPGCHGESLDDLVTAIEDWDAGHKRHRHRVLPHQPAEDPRGCSAEADQRTEIKRDIGPTPLVSESERVR